MESVHCIDGSNVLQGGVHFLLALLESDYSLIRGAHRIWGQGLGTFIISKPISQGSDWWKFSVWKSRCCLSVMSFYTRQQCGCNVHDVIFYIFMQFFEKNRSK